MTPTLLGRIQTRLFLVASIGVAWTIAIGPMLRRIAGVDLSGAYRLAFGALVLVGVIGICWEAIYHALQQLRWEKDWPTLFGLLTGLNEGLVVYATLRSGLPWDVGEVPTGAFIIHFASTWLLVWLAANGPMRVLSLRWRFRGGRLL